MKYVIVDTRTDKAIAFGTATFNVNRPDVEIWNHMNRLTTDEDRKDWHRKDHLVGYTEQSSQYQHYCDKAFADSELTR